MWGLSRLALRIHIDNHRPGTGAQHHLTHNAVHAARRRYSLPCQDNKQ